LLRLLLLLLLSPLCMMLQDGWHRCDLKTLFVMYRMPQLLLLLGNGTCPAVLPAIAAAAVAAAAVVLRQIAIQKAHTTPHGASTVQRWPLFLLLLLLLLLSQLHLTGHCISAALTCRAAASFI
jgi:hypothetical protein